ncbi:MAG: glycosyltransferase family A protein [Patulibacter sp.]
MPASYTIISPVKDEADHIERTLRSVCAQTLRPRRWIVVDDGSSDGTAGLVQRYAAEHEWIEYVKRDSSARRARGGAVVQAFNEGLARVADLDRDDVVVKLDGDLYLPPHYFDWVMSTFEGNPAAGIVGGRALVPSESGWDWDPVNPTNVHGAFKAYRLSCFRAIGGLHASMGWDGIDEYAARARGWQVLPLSELTVLHYAKRGSKQRGLRPRWEEGRGSHWIGYTWPFAMLRAGYRALVEQPRILGGGVLGVSFAWHRITGQPQVSDSIALQQVRREQRAALRALLRGRSRHHLPDPLHGPAYDATLARGDGAVEAGLRAAPSDRAS